MTQEVGGPVERHQALLYRPDGESRHSIPAEVCTACSDFDAGRLVAVSLCPVLRADATDWNLSSREWEDRHGLWPV